MSRQMDPLTKCEALTKKFDRDGKIVVNGILFELKDGAVYASEDIEGFENPMTRDTFTYIYLYNHA